MSEIPPLSMTESKKRKRPHFISCPWVLEKKKECENGFAFLNKRFTKEIIGIAIFLKILTSSSYLQTKF